MKKKIIAVILACLGVFSIAGCTRREKYPDALKVGISEIPKNLNPYHSAASANTFVSGLVYDTLLGSYSLPKEAEDNPNWTYPDGSKPKELAKENYFGFEDGLVYMDGAYPKKDGSKYGLEFYEPSKEDYEKQLKLKDIEQGRLPEHPKDETFVESDEEFALRREQAVPTHKWMRYRFKVKEGISWSDGTPFTVDDIVFTFHYALDNPGALAAIAFFLNNHFDSYNDNGDLVLELASNKLSDIQTICNSIFIIPKHLWENIDRPNYEKNLNPVGTGLYKILKEDYIEDQSLTLTLRDDISEEVLKENFYYEPIKHIMLMKIGNEEVMLNGLEKGDIDVSLDSITNTTAIENGSKFHNLKVSEGLGSFVTTLALNVGKKGVFKDGGKFGDKAPLIRKAISLAIDQDRLIKDVLSGNGEKVSDGLVQERYKHALKDENGAYLAHKANVVEANKLLDQAGYPKVDGKRDLTFKVLALKPNEGIVRAIGKMLSENVGIKIDFEMATDTYQSDVKQGLEGSKYEMIINTVTFAENQLLMFDARFGVYGNGSPRIWNVTGSYNKELSDLMYSMDTETDMFRQLDKAKQVQKLVAELYTEIPLYSKFNQIVYTEQRFEGFIADQNGRILNSDSYKFIKRK